MTLSARLFAGEAYLPTAPQRTCACITVLPYSSGRSSRRAAGTVPLPSVGAARCRVGAEADASAVPSGAPPERPGHSPPAYGVKRTGRLCGPRIIIPGRQVTAAGWMSRVRSGQRSSRVAKAMRASRRASGAPRQ
ncbi:hypothetical protein SALBM217S_00609 [Streptomyces griseoloalbus]